MTVYVDRESAEAGGPSARTVLRYHDLIKELASKAKQPGFAGSDWDVLGEVVAIGEFERIGCWLEVQGWPEYLAMMTQWATTTSFATEFRRLSETENLVFLELQENNGGEIVNSLSLYELNGEGKIARLHIYLQRKQQ